MVKKKTVGVLRVSRPLIELFAAGRLQRWLRPRLLPMLVPPRPWRTYRSGGYLTTRLQSMRFRDGCSEQHEYLRSADRKGELKNVLNALDVLGSVPWVVNLKVLEVITSAWNSGKAVADLPPLLTTEQITRMAPRMASDEEGKTSASAKATYRQALRQHANYVQNMFSQRCSVNYTIETAISVR